MSRRGAGGMPKFVEAPAPTVEARQTMLQLQSDADPLAAGGPAEAGRGVVLNPVLWHAQAGGGGAGRALRSWTHTPALRRPTTEPPCHCSTRFFPAR